MILTKNNLITATRLSIAAGFPVARDWDLGYTVKLRSFLYTPLLLRFVFRYD